MNTRGDRRDLPLDGVRVLLVEDYAVVREVIGRLLVGFGARVTAVAGVPEALEALPRARPNVLVSDIDMPGEDGYALNPWDLSRSGAGVRSRVRVRRGGHRDRYATPDLADDRLRA